jgi:hypothetical protein
MAWESFLGHTRSIFEVLQGIRQCANLVTVTEAQLKELLNAVAETKEEEKIVVSRRKGGWDDDDDDDLFDL